MQDRPNYSELPHITPDPRKLPYSEQCKLPQFQKWAAMIKDMARWRCEDCGRGDKQLHAHHTAYVSGLEAWKHGTDLAMCVCSDCHKRRQMLENGFRVALGKITRHLPIDVLEQEIWRMLGEVSARETARLAKGFSE